MAWLVAVLLVGEVGLSAPQQNFDPELRRAVDQLRRRQAPQALKMLDAMLKKYKRPEEVREIRLYRVEALLATKGYTAALAEAARLRTEAGEDRDLQSKAMLFEADALRGKEKFPEAIAAYRKLAKEYASYGERAATALLRAADVYVTNLKKYPEGLAVFGEVEKAFAGEPAKAAEALRQAAVVYETLVKDAVKAGTCYLGLAEKYAGVYAENVRSAYYTKAIDLLRAAGKLPEARGAAAKAEQGLPNVQYKTAYALRQADLLVEMHKSAEARAECERVICTYPLDANTCQGAQTRIVGAYRSESKFPETLGAARILYDAAAGEPHIRAAAQVVAQAFRSVDGDLKRANEFLVYQRFGLHGQDGKPATPDDLKVNHLATAKYPPPDKARDKRFADAIAAQPKTFQGYRAKGYLHAYWGKPKEAAQSFYLALKACTDAEVPQAANELILVGMKAHTASFHGLDTIYEYVSHGPKGKDGKKNIPDPFKGL